MQRIELRGLLLCFALVLVFSYAPTSAATPPRPAGPNQPDLPNEAWENVVTGGFGDINNERVIETSTFGDQLYASVQNNTSGASIRRSSDGSTWTAVVTGGFGDANNRNIYGLVEYDGHLYAGAMNSAPAGQGELWYSSTGDPGDWTQVPNDPGLGADQHGYIAMLVYEGDLWISCQASGATAESAELWTYHSSAGWTQEIIPGFDVDMNGDAVGDNIGIGRGTEFNGDLYFGTFNLATGAQVWRRDGTTQSWEKMAQNGFGDPTSVLAGPLHVYEGKLYAGTYNTTGAALFASSDGHSWEPVFTQGLDDPLNVRVSDLFESNGYLYLTMWNPANGGRIYRSSDGHSWSPVNVAGFGDATNVDARTLVVFEGTAGRHLYAGTTNSTNGVEIWRTALPQPEEAWEQVVQGGYDGDPGTFLTLDFVEYDGALYAAATNTTGGTQVWRTAEGRTWIQVGVDGFGTLGNSAGLTFAVHDARLYVGTMNTASGGGVYRLKENKAEWEQVNAGGFGDTSNTGVRTLASFGGDLYAGTENSTNGAQVRRYTGSGTGWVNVSPSLDPSNERISSMVIYRGYLYMGTRDVTNGAEIWRYDGTTWEPVNTGGQGDTDNTSASSLVSFDGYLYAGYTNDTAGASVWQSPDGLTGWTQVNLAGFGDPGNASVVDLAVWRGYLYAGTTNSTTGAEVWRTSVAASQDDWEQANTDGFSVPENIIIPALQAFGPHLYAGTFNSADGAEVWRTGRPDSGPDDPCCEVVNVGIEVEGACWIRVNGDETTPIWADSAGTYDMPLEGPGTYEITVEYADGNQAWVQPITVVVGTSGAVQISHGTPTPLETPDSPSEAWERVTKTFDLPVQNTMVASTGEFNGQLYAGTVNSSNGGSVLRSSDGSTWQTVAALGFGDANNERIFGLVEYDGDLYAGTYYDGGQAQMWRSATGDVGSWNQVVNGALGAQQSAYVSLLVYEDPLQGQELLWVGCDVESDQATAQLWTYNGTNWTPEIIPGFDVDMNGDTWGDNVGIRAMAEYQGDLYIGTTNYVTGAEVWRRSGTDGSWARVKQNVEFSGGAPVNLSTSAMAVHNNVLYAGTYSPYPNTGAELYATRDGRSWETIFTGGLYDPDNVMVEDLFVSNGYLYMTTANTNGGRVYRAVAGRFWTPVNPPGFGDTSNVRVGALAAFEGTEGTHLYAGTEKANGAAIWRTALPQPEEAWAQVERQGIDDDPNNTEPRAITEFNGAIYLGVANWISGGQVWRSADGRTWLQVGLDGLDGNSSNRAVDGLVVHGGALYAGVENLISGGRVYRWNDTTGTWEQVNLDGFGTLNNRSAQELASFDGHLYAGTWHISDRPEVWRYTGSGTDWDDVSPPDAVFDVSNEWIDAMAVYGNHLYMGTWDSTWGGEVWRYDGAGWEMVTGDGFGDALNWDVTSLLGYNGHLYAGLTNPIDGGEVWRSATGASGTWQQVNQNGFGRNMVNDSQNRDVRSLAEWQGVLYAGTGNSTTGGEVWRTESGSGQQDWEQVNTDGFGQPSNESLNLQGFGDHLYAASRNPVDGVEVWRTGLPGVPGGRFAQVVQAGLRTDQATTIDVSGAADWSYDAPGRGTYAIPLPAAGVYHVSCGCGKHLTIFVDTWAVYLPLVSKGHSP